ncbi:hypothetical protein F5Y02DRAFT_295057 [Annulohypoxylon stygium]|nr:hypothetical protein F5Y02DRAFT_295057 [Annulohypoxylon stygium]
MAVNRLPPLLPRLLGLFRNYEQQQMSLIYQSRVRATLDRRSCFNRNVRSISSVTESPEKVVATPKIPLEENMEEILSVPTTPGDNKTTQEKAKEIEKTVAILWDIDNKVPKIVPEHLAVAIRSLASERGKIIDYSAMANFYAFSQVKAANMRAMEAAKREESAGITGGPINSGSARCPICGKQCTTKTKLKKHYNHLHERELQKKEDRLRLMSKKEKQKFLAREEEALRQHREADIQDLPPEKDVTLFRSLKRAGVLVRLVQSTRVAADTALKQRYAKFARESGLTLIIISDDRDFRTMARKAKKQYGTHVIVVGEREGKLAGVADEWWSWDHVHSTATTNDIDLDKALANIPELDLKGRDYMFDPGLKQLLEVMQSKGAGV